MLAQGNIAFNTGNRDMHAETLMLVMVWPWAVAITSAVAAVAAFLVAVIASAGVYVAAFGGFVLLWGCLCCFCLCCLCSLTCLTSLSWSTGKSGS